MPDRVVLASGVGDILSSLPHVDKVSATNSASSGITRLTVNFISGLGAEENELTFKQTLKRNSNEAN